MVTLTSPINMPNLSRIRIDKILDNDTEVSIIVTVGGVNNAAAFIYGTHELIIRNGQCYGIRMNASANTFNGIVETNPVTLATGLTDFWAAMTGTTRAQKVASIESWLVTVGLLPAGT